MINHKLFIISAGHDPRPEVQDFEVLNIIYKLDTVDFNPESNTAEKYATTGMQVVSLKPWDVNNKIPGPDISNELLEQWVSESVNLEKLKQKNIENLKPVSNDT